MKFWPSKFAARGSMKQVGASLERIADCLEFVCAEQYGYNARPPKADMSGAEPVTSYVDEEADAFREYVELLEKQKGKTVNEET